MASPTEMSAENSIAEAPPAHEIEYLSPAAEVSMGDRWFDIASIDHFWVRRRFEVLQRLADALLSGAGELAEVGCGHGLLQRQIEDAYGRKVTGFDLNENALKQNISRLSRVCCYDIYQRDAALRASFDMIFLFDVLEHIPREDDFLKAVLFHLKPDGKLVINVPAGQWAYSVYDRAVGHVRRYSMGTLREVFARSGLRAREWSYWGLPLLPMLMLRKLWLMGRKNTNNIISAGMDSRTATLNSALGALARCEIIPQKLLGTSLMAIFQPATHGRDAQAV
jgi:SAM-dependent methyltransferase